MQKLELLVPVVPTDLLFCIWDMGDQGTYPFFSFCIHIKSTAHPDLQWEVGIPMLSMYQMSQNGHLENETRVY